MNRFQQLTPHLQVLSITTDFEVGLRNVLRGLYPNAVLKGCYFHYVQVGIILFTSNNYKLYLQVMFISYIYKLYLEIIVTSCIYKLYLQVIFKSMHR